MMRLTTTLVGTAILCSGSVSSAETKHPGIAMCHSSNRAKPLMTPMFMTNRTDQSELRTVWQKYASTAHGNDNPSTLGCYIYPWDAREIAKKTHASFPTLMRDWLYPAPEVVRWRPSGETVKGEAQMLAELGVAAAPRESSSGSITIEDNGVAARIAAWEDVKLQAKREEAALKVKQAIGTAQSKAEYERILAKAKAAAKKLGRRQ